MLCDICGREWVGVAPAETLEAECPGCGTMQPIPDVFAEEV